MVSTDKAQYAKHHIHSAQENPNVRVCATVQRTANLTLPNTHHQLLPGQGVKGLREQNPAEAQGLVS